MLKQLTLKNFVLVEALDINFKPGFTTITGESGAGKSILLSALGLLLGQRANTSDIRPGCDKADVSAEFDLAELPKLRDLLEQDDLESEDIGQCLIRRVVSRQGRSRAFVNGVPVTTQYLRDLGEQLVEIYGQNEHQRLDNHTNQLIMLDEYAGLTAKTQRVRAAWDTWQATNQQIADLEAALTSATDRKDLLTYQLEELSALNLKDGDFEVLETEHKRLANAQATLETLYEATQNVATSDSLRQGTGTLNHIDDDHEILISATTNLNDAIVLIDDAVRDLRRYQDQIVVDPETLSLVSERLDTVLNLARKHRVRPQDLYVHIEALELELNGLNADDSALATLKDRLSEDEAAYRKAALTLSKARRKAAPKFAKMVGHYMQLLGISTGTLEVAFEKSEWAFGTERVTFLITTNPNFPAGTLNQIASGGEQTRIALAIQIVAAENSALPCLILDEADIGVGGTTADTIGRILRDLGNHTQVICITHAPQVAALGNNHFCVVKEKDNTNIQILDEAHRIDELARMLAGSGITEQTRDYAATLLEAAE